MSDNHEAKMCTPYPHVDWKETRDAHVVNIDLPGVEKEAVALGMAEGRILEISGQLSKEEEKQDGEKYHRAEVLKGSFNRRFKLPEDAKVDEAKATMENGVLTVIVPKRLDYQPPPKFREVEISD